MNTTELASSNTPQRDYWLIAAVTLFVLSAVIGGGMILYALTGTFIGFGGLAAYIILLNGIYGMLFGGLVGAVFALVSYVKKGGNRKSLVVIMLNVCLAVVPVSCLKYKQEQRHKRDQAALEAQTPTQRLFGLVSVTQFNQQEFVKFLELGGDINAVDQRGFTLLTVATITVNDPEVIDFLVSKGADVNKQGYEGWTPLHTAASGGKVEMLKKLLENRADPTIKTDKGETALVIAKDRHGLYKDNEWQQKQYELIISILDANHKAPGKGETVQP